MPHALRQHRGDVDVCRRPGGSATACATERAVEVDVHHVVPLRLGQVEERPRDRHAGVVDQHVDGRARLALDGLVDAPRSVRVHRDRLDARAVAPHRRRACDRRCRPRAHAAPARPALSAVAAEPGNAPVTRRACRRVAVHGPTRRRAQSVPSGTRGTLPTPPPAATRPAARAVAPLHRHQASRHPPAEAPRSLDATSGSSGPPTGPPRASRRAFTRTVEALDELPGQSPAMAARHRLRRGSRRRAVHAASRRFERGTSHATSPRRVEAAAAASPQSSRGRPCQFQQQRRRFEERSRRHRIAGTPGAAAGPAAPARAGPRGNACVGRLGIRRRATRCRSRSRG